MVLQPTRHIDELVDDLWEKAVMPSAASASAHMKLKVSLTHLCSAQQRSLWVQQTLQLEKYPFSPNFNLIAIALQVEPLRQQQQSVEQRMQQLFGMHNRAVPEQLPQLLLQWCGLEQQLCELGGSHMDARAAPVQQLLQQQQSVEQQLVCLAPSPVVALQWQPLLAQWQQLVGSILNHQQHARALHLQELEERAASAAATRLHGSVTYSSIRDTTLLWWYRFPPLVMLGFFCSFVSEKGNIPQASTAGKDRHHSFTPWGLFVCVGGRQEDAGQGDSSPQLDSHSKLQRAW